MIERRGQKTSAFWAGLILTALIAHALLLLVSVAGGDEGDEAGTIAQVASTILLLVGLVAHIGLNRERGHLAVAWPGLLFPFVFVLFHFGSALGSVSWFLPDMVGLAWQLAALSLLAWMLGYNLVRGRLRIVRRPTFVIGVRRAPADELKTVTILGQLVFWAGFAFQLVFLMDFGIEAFFSRSYGKQALTPTGGNWTVYLYAIGQILLMVGLIVTSLASAASRGKVIPNVVYGIGLGIYLVSLIFEGDRGTLSLALIPLFIVFHYWVRPMRWRTALGLLFVALVLFSGLRTFRGTKDIQQLARVSSDVGVATLTVVEMGTTLDTVVRSMWLVPERQDFFLGMTYVWAAARAFPNLRLQPRTWGFISSVWVTRETAPEIARRHGGLGFSIVAEAYINFGLFGGPLFLLLLGALHGRAERAMASDAVRFWPAVLFLVAEVALLSHVRNSAVAYVRGFLWMGAVVLAIFMVVQVGRRGRRTKA